MQSSNQLIQDIHETNAASDIEMTRCCFIPCPESRHRAVDLSRGRFSVWLRPLARPMRRRQRRCRGRHWDFVKSEHDTEDTFFLRSVGRWYSASTPQHAEWTSPNTTLKRQRETYSRRRKPDKVDSGKQGPHVRTSSRARPRRESFSKVERPGS
jgi:hypothetical protein